jgi:hypothetical protein
MATRNIGLMQRLATRARRVQWQALVATLALLAGGCTLLPPAEPRLSLPRGSETAAPSEAPSDSSATGAEADRGTAETGAGPAAPPVAAASPASTMLLEQSRRERAAGSLDDAADSIERALRIDPDNPWLWLELGEIHMMAGDSTQAEEMARKALSLAGSDQALVGQADRLLAAIRSR